MFEFNHEIISKRISREKAYIIIPTHDILNNIWKKNYSFNNYLFTNNYQLLSNWCKINLSSIDNKLFVHDQTIRTAMSLKYNKN